MNCIVLENGKAGGVIAGPPSVLAGICANLGFRNSCKSGRVFLTAAHMAKLGLADAPSAVPNWRELPAETLTAISRGELVPK